MNEEDNPIKQFQNWEERKAKFRKNIPFLCIFCEKWCWYQDSSHDLIMETIIIALCELNFARI